MVAVVRKFRVGVGSGLAYNLNASQGSYSLSGDVATLTKSSTQTFDYYISTTGNDTNSGTLASPWAITSLRTTSANWSLLAGKRIGLLPGTYNVGSLMHNDPTTGALQIPGGSSGSWTYLGSSDSSGHYSARQATITAYYNSLFGGHTSSSAGSWDGPILSHTGNSWLTGSKVTYSVGYLEIDGIVFQGFNYKGIRIGGNSSGNGPIITGPVTFHNCELTAGGFNSGDYQDNLCALWVDTFQPSGSQGCLVTNNWVHDIVGYSANDGDHLTPLFVFSAPSTGWGYEFSYNTVVNAGAGPYGKEGGIEGSNIHHNYVDVSSFTSYVQGFLDWASGSTDQHAGLTKQSYFQNNIVLMRGNTAGGNNAFGFPTLGQNTYGSSWGWQTPLTFENNTVICTAGTAGPLVLYGVSASDGVGQGQLTVRNNVYKSSASAGSWNSFGNFLTTAKTPGAWDYNLYPSSGVQWGVVPEAINGSLCASHTLYSSVSTFAAAISAGGGISGVDAHSLTGTPTFVGSGLYAAQYQLTSGSVGHNAGSDGTDMGAWGGSSPPSQIGCSFAT